MKARFEVELEQLTKEEIIALVRTGALKRVETVTEVVEKVVEVETKPEPQKRTKKTKKKKKRIAGKTLKILHKVRMQLAREPKDYTIKKMAEKTGVSMRRIYHLTKNYLPTSRWCKVELKNNKFILSPTEITATGDYDVEQRNGRDDWHDFQRKRFNELKGTGFGRGEMMKQVAEEWHRIKKGEQIKKEGSPSLPRLKSVKSDKQHLAKALLTGLFKNKQPITYKSAQYFLEFNKRDEFNDFVTEVFKKQEEFKDRLGIKKASLKFNGNSNRLEAH